MHDSEKCFVTTIKESVRLIELPKSNQLPVVARAQRIQSLKVPTIISTRMRTMITIAKPSIQVYNPLQSSKLCSVTPLS